MRAIGGIALFANVVEAPIKAVEIEMDVSAVRAVSAEGVLGIAAPLIALHGRGRTGPIPVIVEGAVESEGVEFFDRRIGIEIVAEFARSVEGLEEDAQAVLRDGVAADAPLDAQAAVEIESLLAVRPHVFERAGMLCGFAGQVGIG